MNNAFVSCFTTVLCYMGLIFSPLVLFPTPARAEMTPEEILRFQYDFAANIYQKYADSVVFVTGSFIDPQTKSLDEYFNNDKKKLDNSIGTGFFILPSGYVLTNAHGVHKSIDQIVETRDDKSYPAEVVGFILNQDIALLKVELPKPAVCVTLREKGQIQPGEPIVTIGHPHGLKYTCTQGIISAVGRRSLLSDIKVTLDDLLQSDAGINPGSSGGPWFDASCQAIGMTASRRAGSDNIAFGVSCSTILKLLPELFDFPRRNGYVLGFTVRWENENCVIDNLIPQSEAEKSGLKNGDILTSVNGKKISGMMDFISEEELFKPEQKIQITVSRQEKNQSVEQSASIVLAKAQTPDTNKLLWEKIGLKVRPITEDEVKQCELKSPWAYVVTQVDSPRYAAIQHSPSVGDILGKFDYVRPRSMEHLGRLLQHLSASNRVSLVFLRVTDKNNKTSILLPPAEESNPPESPNSDQTVGDKAASTDTVPVKKQTAKKERIKTRIDIMDFPVK